MFYILHSRRSNMRPLGCCCCYFDWIIWWNRCSLASLHISSDGVWSWFVCFWVYLHIAQLAPKEGHHELQFLVTHVFFQLHIVGFKIQNDRIFTTVLRVKKKHIGVVSFVQPKSGHLINAVLLLSFKCAII